MSKNFHDWELAGIVVNWPENWVRITVVNQFEQIEILAKDFLNLSVPRREAWGPSVSVNKAIGPEKYDEKNYIMKLEMQTGDVVVVIGPSIELLESASKVASP